MASASLRSVALWLIFCCGMIAAMVVLGGITRLTLSGVSITEWQPVTGIVPPLSHQAWLAEFEKYVRDRGQRFLIVNIPDHEQTRFSRTPQFAAHRFRRLRLPEPLMRPAADERNGYVPNVVYSCGGMIHDGLLLLPYGVSDAAVRFAFFDVAELLARLTTGDSPATMRPNNAA